MSGGAVCPSCGVAVVPGYVKCPKCHKSLPVPGRRATALGGTAVSSTNKLPLAIGGGMIALALITLIVIRARAHTTEAPRPVPSVQPGEPTAAQAPTPVGTAEPTQTAAAPAKPNPDVAANQLERALKRHRLWSTVAIVGNHVDVRSSSCADPAMHTLLDSVADQFKAAGVAKLRCLEQGGALVFERDL